MTEPTADSWPTEQAPSEEAAALDVAMLLDGEFETVAQVLGLEEPAPVPPAEEPAETPDPEPPEPVAEDPPVADGPDEPPVAPEQVAEKPAEAPRAPTHPAPQPEPKPVAAGAEAQHGRVSQAVVTILKPINYPLRLVPEPVRPLVDWVILSLVFWVPVTWAIVMMVG
jgi:outer membrane biosynthesis protein TonB